MISDLNRLCLECGLCCNGVIFDKGQLQPKDDAARLQTLGLAILPSRKAQNGTPKFKQPCAMLNGCRCQIYKERPQYCREFECLLLKRVKAGKTESAAALRLIGKTKRRAQKVASLLEKLGEADERIALSVRFRRVQKRFENDVSDTGAVGLYGELTLAFHDLSMLLSQKFYPG
ncbi:MAG: YkgJ family cysteine cluster protein [Verrucomicrobiota bacterium]